MFENSYWIPVAFVVVFTGFASLAYQGYLHENSLTPEDRIQRQKHNACISKVRGSRPFCWKAEDWEAYCQYVQCKPEAKELWENSK